MAPIKEESRSRVMASIRSRDTVPERRLRQALRQLGVKGYRLHRRDLPGRPDIAFVGRRVAVFVDGAYWHGHPEFVRPAASEYWRLKIQRNREKDRLSAANLKAAGWMVVRLWDFEVTSDADGCAERIKQILVNVP